MPLIEFTDRGLYCREGDFYIDPWQPVNRSIITHAHSDHARAGNEYYLTHPDSIPVLKARLGDHNFQPLEWNESLTMNGVRISLHPAGHVIGSSQVRVEKNGEVWVFTGDFKTQDDGISGAYEPVKCDVLITESTFGLPIFQWKSQQQSYTEIGDWILQNQDEDKNSVLIAYSLGKAQRVLMAAAAVTDRIYVHGAVYNMHQALNNVRALPDVIRVQPEMTRADFNKAVIIAPPGAEGSSWTKRFQPFRTGICSGWMQIRGNARRKNADKGFVLSDHADWAGLQEAVKATQARQVFVTHGFQSAFSRYLAEQGIEAAEVKTAYGNDEEVDPSEPLEEKTGEA